MYLPWVTFQEHIVAIQRERNVKDQCLEISFNFGQYLSFGGGISKLILICIFVFNYIFITIFNKINIKIFELFHHFPG